MFYNLLSNYFKNAVHFNAVRIICQCLTQCGIFNIPMSDMYDVIVAGAGPGGSLCAYHLAKKNLRVLLLDKEEFPRVKVCAGGIPKKALDALPFDVTPAIDKVVSTFVYHYAGDDEPVTVDVSDTPVAMTCREKLDYFLLTQAEKAGADIVFKTAVTDIKMNVEKVTVFCGDKTFAARFVAASDGATSKIRQLLGKSGKNRPALGIEMEAPYSMGRDDERNNTALQLAFGYVPREYAWGFPKNGHLSIGIASSRVKGANLRGIMTPWMEKLGFYSPDVRVLAHQIPLWERDEKLNVGRVVFVGDAARLVDPLTGEGIRQAMLSGTLAADVLSAAQKPEDLEAYNVSVRKTLTDDYKYAKRLAFLFYNFQKPAYMYGLKHPRITKLFAKVHTGEITYKQLLGRAFSALRARLKS